MTFVSVFTGIVSIAKAIPKIKEIIDDFVGFWIDAQVKEIEKVYNNQRIQRKSLMKAIGNAQTDEERKALSLILADFNRSKLSK